MREPSDIIKKLHGYHGIGRGVLLLLHKQILTKEEFILYEASFSFASWDKEKKVSYGVIDLTQEEIEWLLNVSAGYVSKLKEGLIEKGFWRINKNKKIEVVGFELIETSVLSRITKNSKVVDYYDYIAHKQNEFASEQKLIAHKQTNISKENTDNQPQKFAHKQTVSSISDISSYKDRCNSLKSEEEYKKIKEEMGFSSLTIEDMKWIDTNVHENSTVSS